MSHEPRVLAIDAGGTMTDTFIVDGGGEAREMDAYGGQHTCGHDPYSTLSAFRTGDLYLSSGRGGGLGDPLHGFYRGWLGRQLPE